MLALTEFYRNLKDVIMSSTAFPWGIYLGSFYSDSENIDIPFFISSECGGVLVEYYDEIENKCDQFIEQIVLSISAAISSGLVHYHIFDYSHKKRFNYLSELASYGLYHVYLNSKQAQDGFSFIESESQMRHHERLSINVPTVSIYNKKNPIPLHFRIIIINLDCYPEDNQNMKRLEEFLKHSFDAGYYIIAFGNQKTLNLNKAVLFKKFFKIKNLGEDLDALKLLNKLNINETQLAEKITDEFFVKTLRQFKFKTILNIGGINQAKIIGSIKQSLSEDKISCNETDFLNIPVAKTLDGINEINFDMGAKSGCYHAIITGGTGTGKSVFLNNLITSIAEKYTAKEVRLNLMDYKEGLEFDQFKVHPNTENLFLSNNGKLTQESKRVAFKFLEDFICSGTSLSKKLRDKNCKNIDEYNRNNPNDLIPHRILIIDEIEQIYANMGFKEKDELNALFSKILKQGRAWGIHLIICTQELLRSSDLPLAELKGQSKLRVTFKLQNNTEILDDDSLDIPKSLGKYEVLINNDAGKKNAHQRGHAFPPKSVSDILNKIWRERKPSECVFCKVFDHNTLSDLGNFDKNYSANTEQSSLNDIFDR